jgi:hypothetical protein
MQIENKNWLGKNLLASGCLSFAQARGGRRKTKKPRTLSACGAKAFVAFNSIVVLRDAGRGSFPEFLRP